LALNFRSLLPANPVAQQEINNTGALSEQLVMIGAASLALLVVAAIAVLMGMAWIAFRADCAWTVPIPACSCAIPRYRNEGRGRRVFGAMLVDKAS